MLAKGDFCKQAEHNLNVFIIVKASGLPRPESTCLRGRGGVAGSREKDHEGTDHKHLKHRGFNRKETAHLVTTYSPGGKERPDHERVRVCKREHKPQFFWLFGVFVNSRPAGRAQGPGKGEGPGPCRAGAMALRVPRLKNASEAVVCLEPAAREPKAPLSPRASPAWLSTGRLHRRGRP